MPYLVKITRGLSSPAILIVVVWCATLIAVAVGPIDYRQPSLAVLLLVAAGLLLFIVAYQGGRWSSRACLRHRENFPAPSVRILNIVLAAASIAGLIGIALIALDRSVLVNGGEYAQLLRCAPGLVDFIDIKRTPLIYVGYLTFSFGFAALPLFLLKGEEIRGWTAVLSQLSILSPVGYALLYSGRMPILIAIVLIVATVLVRAGEGRSPLPKGHYLLVKMILFVALFGIYSNAMWSSRRDFCVQMNGVIQELLSKKEASTHEPPPTTLPEVSQPDERVNTVDLNKMIAGTPPDVSKPTSSEKLGELLGVMQEAWHVRPRDYVLRAIESGHLSPEAAKDGLSAYFYLTHGVRIFDITWQARSKFTPHWGVYEIGILSPILRVFFPQDQRLAEMNLQLKTTGIYGFFPTVWAAAFIDFGAVGAVIYVLIWGYVAGWSAFGARHSTLVTPSLLLIFILASILLSMVQGPLGNANSALVLVSMVIVGLAIDLDSLRASSRRESSAPIEPEASV